MDRRHEVLRAWISENFNPMARVHINQYIPDFMLRRLFERSQEGFPVNQDEFVAAMNEAGFNSRQTRNKDWVFNISDAEYRKALRRSK
jgi:hypothetical protein